MNVIDISWPISKATTGYKDRSIVNIEEIKNFNRDCIVLDMTTCAERITRDCLIAHDNDIVKDSIVLLRTANSDLNPTDKFSPHFVYLEASGALYLAEKKVKAVGIDYLGIEHSQPGHP